MTHEEIGEVLHRLALRNQEEPEPKPPCSICHNTGVIPGTGTEQLWGEECPNGCEIDTQLLRDREKACDTRLPGAR